MRTLFAGGQVFDGTGAAPGDADVVVEDGRIVAVGPGLDGDERVDASGQTVLAGLFDCHPHVLFGDVDQWKYLQTPFSLTFYKAMDNLRATLACGITTIRDAGGADLGMKTAVEQGLIPGPRMHISIRMISQTGGHRDHRAAGAGAAPVFLENPPTADALCARSLR